MDGAIRRQRQKFPFTIEDILSRYPNSGRGRRSAGLNERAASPVVAQAEVFGGGCLCCCCCCSHPHREDLLQAGTGDLLYSWATAKLADPRRPGHQEEEEEENPGPTQRRTRRHRTIFTEEQLDALEELFLQNQYPDVNTREKLAQQTRLREERVEVRRLPCLSFTPARAHTCSCVDRSGSKTAEPSGGARKGRLSGRKRKRARCEESPAGTDRGSVSRWS